MKRWLSRINPALSIFTFLFFVNHLYAQEIPVRNGDLLFLETTFNFGEIDEGEIITHKFDFTNTGDKPVRLTDVNATCGCTIADYTKKPTEPGKGGTITVKFVSNNRIGDIKSTVFIEHDGESRVEQLTLTGFVKAKPITGKDVTEVGPFRISEKNLELNQIATGKKVRRLVKIQNVGQGKIGFKSERSPDFITVTLPPFMIEKGATASVHLTINTVGLEPGLQSYDIKLMPYDTSLEPVLLTIHATVIDESRSDADASIIEFESTLIDLGKIKKGETVNTSFIFRNKGSKELQFKSIRPGCGCTVTDLTKPYYQPGEQGKMDVTFNTDSLIGEVIKDILIETNDPGKPEIRLIIKAEISEK